MALVTSIKSVAQAGLVDALTASAVRHVADGAWTMLGKTVIPGVTALAIDRLVETVFPHIPRHFLSKLDLRDRVVSYDERLQHALEQMRNVHDTDAWRHLYAETLPDKVRDTIYARILFGLCSQSSTEFVECATELAGSLSFAIGWAAGAGAGAQTQTAPESMIAMLAVQGSVVLLKQRFPSRVMHVSLDAVVHSFAPPAGRQTPQGELLASTIYFQFFEPMVAHAHELDAYLHMRRGDRFERYRFISEAIGAMRLYQTYITPLEKNHHTYEAMLMRQSFESVATFNLSENNQMPRVPSSWQLPQQQTQAMFFQLYDMCTTHINSWVGFGSSEQARVETEARVEWYNGPRGLDPTVPASTWDHLDLWTKSPARQGDSTATATAVSSFLHRMHHLLMPRPSPVIVFLNELQRILVHWARGGHGESWLLELQIVIVRIVDATSRLLSSPDLPYTYLAFGLSSCIGVGGMLLRAVCPRVVTAPLRLARAMELLTKRCLHTPPPAPAPGVSHDTLARDTHNVARLMHAVSGNLDGAVKVVAQHSDALRSSSDRQIAHLLRAKKKHIALEPLPVTREEQMAAEVYRASKSKSESKRAAQLGDAMIQAAGVSVDAAVAVVRSKCTDPNMVRMMLPFSAPTPPRRPLRRRRPPSTLLRLRILLLVLAATHTHH
jgi:hypothetical protein